MTTTVSLITPEDVEDGRVHVLQDKQLPPYVSIIRIHGPFLFGTTETLLDKTADVSRYAPIVVLRVRNMTAIDATGLHAFTILHARLKRSGRTLLICGARDQPAGFLQRTDCVDEIGSENILPNVTSALARAKVIHESFDGMGGELAAEIRSSPL